MIAGTRCRKVAYGGYFAGEFATRQKADDSPVTDADIAANHLIVKAVSKFTPHIPIIAEEDAEPGREDHALFLAG